MTPFLLSFQLQASHAVDKVGATCTMVGSKSVVGKTTLSCTKSGNKLVWAKLTDPTPTPSPTFTCPDGSCGNPNISVPLNPSEISKLKKEIEALKTKYSKTRDPKEKTSINNKIAELEKKLEGLIKKEIEGLKAKYNQTKDAKEKESIAKRIDELTRQLQSGRTKIILNEQSN